MGKKEEGLICVSCGSRIPLKRAEAIREFGLLPVCLECKEAQEATEKDCKAKSRCKRVGGRGKPRGPFSQMHDCLR